MGGIEGLASSFKKKNGLLNINLAYGGVNPNHVIYLAPPIFNHIDVYLSDGFELTFYYFLFAM